MRRTRIIASLVAVLLCGTAALAQNSADWPRYTFGELFSIAVPGTLELRDPDTAVGKFMDSGRKTYSMKMGEIERGTTTVFWPGLGSSRYARIMVNLASQPEITQSLLASLTEADMKELDASWKQGNVQMGKMAGTTVRWIGSWKEKYSGKYGFHLAYQRSGLDGDIRVDQYKIYDRGKEISITISYRISEASTWKADLGEVIKSLRF